MLSRPYFFALALRPLLLLQLALTLLLLFLRQDFHRVIDFFLGSGTCLIACEQTQRRCYASEIKPKFVQSAIKRYLRHCAAKNIEVNFAHVNGELTIEDDGVGYDAKALKSGTHHGLQNIQYRVNSMNGNFTLDSNAKSGTMLLITLPV